MARPKGLPKTGGRQKGSLNKTTRDLKDMILQALDAAGGVKYLKRQAAKSPAAFMTLVGKVLPLQVTGDKDNPLHVEHTAAAREKVASGIAELASRFGAGENPERANGKAIH